MISSNGASPKRGEVSGDVDMMTQEKRGGKRKGAGRKSKHEGKTSVRSIRLPDLVWEGIDEIRREKSTADLIFEWYQEVNKKR